MNFLQETVWVMLTHGLVYFVCGLALSFALVIGASRCARLKFRLPILLGAILVLWVAMFVAADSGYRAWQQIQNSPEEAFSDTGPMVFLLLGWLPGSVILSALLLLCRRIFPLPPSPSLEPNSEQGGGGQPATRPESK